MGSQLGIIAGSGEFPSFILEQAQKSGYSCVVAAITGEADASLQEKVDLLEWFNVDEVKRLISFFQTAGVSQAVFTGKVDPRILYKKESWDEESFSIRDKARTKSPIDLVEAVIAYLAAAGIEVISPYPFLRSSLCQEGLLTSTKPPLEVEEDIAFGWRTARTLADMGIGQTVIIKDKAVVAVEGIEGTDEAVLRGGNLAGEGTVVIKVARTQQDFRVDLPVVGLNTVKSLVAARSRALCFEAEKMPFLNQAEAVSLADAHAIAILAKTDSEQGKAGG